jgi:hypothetical protein
LKEEMDNLIADGTVQMLKGSATLQNLEISLINAK